MAVASLIGGDTVFNNLSPATQQLLDAVLGDTVDGINGVVTTPLSGGGTLVTGTGAGGVQQGAVIGAAGEAVTGEVVDGALTLSIALPAGLNVLFEGLDGTVSAGQANDYITNLVNSLLPADSTDPGILYVRNSLLESINALTGSLSAGGAPVTVRLIALTESNTSTPARATGPNDVVFKGTNTGGTTELLTFFTQNLGENKTLVLQEVQAALIVGSGTVRIDGSSASFLAGDFRNQTLIGGTGNDTLVGGGGNDTITGGLGNDVFGITALGANALGHVTITDFDVAHDKLAFNVPGVTKIADLVPFFTSLTVESGASTLHFGDNVSVTLVGVSPEQLTLDLLKFTF